MMESKKGDRVKVGGFDVAVHVTDACPRDEVLVVRPGLVLTEDGRLMVDEGGTLRPAGKGDVARIKVKGDDDGSKGRGEG